MWTHTLSVVKGTWGIRRSPSLGGRGYPSGSKNSGGSCLRLRGRTGQKWRSVWGAVGGKHAQWASTFVMVQETLGDVLSGRISLYPTLPKLLSLRAICLWEDSDYLFGSALARKLRVATNIWPQPMLRGSTGGESNSYPESFRNLIHRRNLCYFLPGEGLFFLHRRRTVLLMGVRKEKCTHPPASSSHDSRKFEAPFGVLRLVLATQNFFRIRHALNWSGMLPSQVLSYPESRWGQSSPGFDQPPTLHAVPTAGCQVSCFFMIYSLGARWEALSQGSCCVCSMPSLRYSTPTLFFYDGR